MNKISIFALLIFATINSIALAAETVYVSSKQAKLYKEASFRSDLIGVVKQNESLNVVQRKGVWVQVRSSGLNGWVSKYSTTSTPPIKEKISIFTRIKNFFSYDKKRERVAVVSTAGGIRGLADAEQDSSGKKDYAAVENLENLKVNPAEVDEFVKGNAN